ncbi:MAG: CopG family ribbon-helix-helix protein [Candidatus Njordarchaeia archaeon]
MAIITVSLPDRILNKLDKHKESGGYMSRSEIIRDALKQYFYKEDLKKAEKTLTVILIVSESAKKSAEEKILTILHKNKDIITNFTHMHVEGYCVETLTCLGETKRITDIVRKIRKLKGVISVREAMIPM